MGQDLMWKARLFLSLGAAMEKAGSPLDLRCKCNTERGSCEDYTSDLGQEYGKSRPEIYCGAIPLRALNTNNILKLTLNSKVASSAEQAWEWYVDFS